VNTIEHIIKNISFESDATKGVLFVNPPDASKDLFSNEAALRKNYWSYPAYGLGILSSLIESIDVNCNIVNLNHEILKGVIDSNGNNDFESLWKHHLNNEISKGIYDIVVITCMFSQTHESAKDVVDFLLEYESNILLCMGGVHTTNAITDARTRKKFVLDFHGVDLFFLYESEYDFFSFVKYLKNKDRIHDDSDNTIINNVVINSDKFINNIPGRIPPSESDINVIPSQHLMDISDISKYGNIGGFHSVLKPDSIISTIIANRGCRARCTFCSVSSFNGRGVRHRTVNSLIEELTILRYEYGVDHVMWLDDDFLHDKKSKIELFNGIVKNGIDITWDCTNGVLASSCTDEVISAARDSGCIGLTIGVESGNREILREIRKPGTAEVFFKASEVLRRYPEINSRVFLMIGFPGETYGMINDTVTLAEKMALDWYNITIYQPLPNTEITVINNQDSEILDFEHVRYNSGPYGKQNDSNSRLNSIITSDIFGEIDLNAVPDRGEQLDEIWFNLNHRLNFIPLRAVDNEEKLRQQFLYLKNIAYTVAPNDPFALHYYLLLNKTVGNSDDIIVSDRLKDVLSSSDYWMNKYSEYGLHYDNIT